MAWLSISILNDELTLHLLNLNIIRRSELSGSVYFYRNDFIRKTNNGLAFDGFILIATVLISRIKSCKI